MKCPKCVEEGKKSTVQPGVSSCTLMSYSGYYNKEGTYVNVPDPNTHYTDCTCSNGHKFTETRQHGEETKYMVWEGK